MDSTASTHGDDNLPERDRDPDRSMKCAPSAHPLARWRRSAETCEQHRTGAADAAGAWRARWANLLLLGALALGVLALAAGLAGHLLFGAGLSVGFEVEPLEIAGAIAGIVLNRRGCHRAVGLLLVALAAFPVVVALLSSPTVQLEPAQIPALYFLAATVLVAAMLLPPGVVFPVAALNSLLAVATLTVLPRSAAFARLFARPDSLVILVAQIVAFQFLVAGAAIALAATGRQAESRAIAAEAAAEIVALDSERTRDDERHRHQIDEGLRQLLAVLGQLARGDTSTRIPTRSGDVLVFAHIWSTVEGIVERLRNLSVAEQTLERERTQIAAMLQALRTARDGRPVAWPAASGVPVDELIAEITSGAVALPRPVRGAVHTASRDVTAQPRADHAGAGSGALPHLGSGSLPPEPTSGALPGLYGSGPLPLKPGSGPLPPHLGSGPLFLPGTGPLAAKPGSGQLRGPATGSLRSLGDQSLLARLQSGPLPPKPASGPLPEPSPHPPAPASDVPVPAADATS